MSYSLKISDNNGQSIVEGIPTLAEVCKERAQLIKAYNLSRRYGFSRENDGDSVIFRHAIYSTMIFETVKEQ